VPVEDVREQAKLDALLVVELGLLLVVVWKVLGLPRTFVLAGGGAQARDD
jgi:hypothetical protein